MLRKAKIKRQTTETDITIELALDGTGQHQIKTGIGFFDHMLIALSVHGLFDINVDASFEILVEYTEDMSAFAVPICEQDDFGVFYGNLVAEICDR